MSEDVDEIIAPGYEGEFGVLPEHTPFLAILAIGILRYRKGTDVRKLAVGGGFAEVMPDRVVVMADVAEKAEEIDVDRAQAAFKDAQDRLLKLTEQDQHHGIESARVRRAAARLHVAGK